GLEDILQYIRKGEEEVGVCESKEGECVGMMQLQTLTLYDLRNIQFVSLKITYLFYYWFAKINGFATRSKEGFKEKRGLTIENRKCEAKCETRYECEEKLRIHVDINCGLWYIT
ncbi:hypothetical protein CR513_07513, partial [Mucuna pruriens]